MSPLPKGTPSMCILAFPLARVKIHQHARLKPYPNFDPRTVPIFYHFDLVAPSRGREDLSWYKKVLKKVMNKAEDIWTSFGRAPKGSWKLWTYESGRRIADRIEFEELILRAVDPSLGPVAPLIGANKQVNDARKNSDQLHSLQKIPLIYPPSLYPYGGTDHALHPSLAHLKTLLESREPRHRRGFYLWMLIAPLTAPITLIPIIPNLPFFFCVWRSWSHYRAYKSSRYLFSLLDHGLIEPNPSLELDKLYESSTLGNIASDGKSEAASGMEASCSGCILLTHKAMTRILETFRLPESAAVNMDRAMNQARGRLGQ